MEAGNFAQPTSFVEKMKLIVTMTMNAKMVSYVELTIVLVTLDLIVQQIVHCKV